MFGLWRKIEERGSVAIPLRTEALSRLEWAEVSERYPELIPDECRGYDVYDDGGLICRCPFVREGNAYKFRVEDPSVDKRLNVFVNTRELINMLCAKDYEGSLFAGALTCSCGIPDCDGISMQSAHVSNHMVRWDVCRYKQRHVLFFGREAYDQGVARMLHDLCRSDSGIDLTVGGGYERKDYLIDGVRDLLVRHPYYADIWTEYGFAVLV